MDAREAFSLIESAVGPSTGIWADLGAGTGTFTCALAEVLTPPSRVYAVDADREALATLADHAAPAGVDITGIHADFTDPAALAAIGDEKLDGILAANALHFVRDAEGVLARWIGRLVDRGRVVVIEYDRRDASRWVPYPVPPRRLEEIASNVGLSPPRVTATRPSIYTGTMYVAVMEMSFTDQRPASI